MPLEADLLEIPEHHKLTLVHYDAKRTRIWLGPTGREDFETSTKPTPPEGIPLWHATIEQQQGCSQCQEYRGMLWFKGHGHTPDEAIQEALSSMRSYPKPEGHHAT